MKISDRAKYYSDRVLKKIFPDPNKEELIKRYVSGGRIPWTQGYIEYKTDYIEKIITDKNILNKFLSKQLPADFAIGIDERAIEYPWIFSRLSEDKNILLDAGSTFNFDFIVEHPNIKNKELTIYTFFPERDCFFKNRINYVYGDLRELYFKNEAFDEIVSQSTIEHIDMDNSIYGYDEKKNTKGERSFEYLKAVLEMIRVLKPSGKLLITFPYGKYEHHGFFQQLDSEMLQRILNLFDQIGKVNVEYFLYEKSGWRFARQSELALVESFNPHTGKGKGNDGAAHCRSIACIEFIKNR